MQAGVMLEKCTHAPFIKLVQFEKDWIVTSGQAGCTFQKIAAHIEHVWQQKSNKHSYTDRQGSRQPYTADNHQNQCILKVAVEDCIVCTA